MFDASDAQPPLLVLLLEPEGELLAVSLEPEPLLEDEADGDELEPLDDWSLEVEGELELGVLLEELELGELELPLSLFIARLPVDEPEDDEPEGLDGDEDAMPDEPDEPEEPDWDRRESLPRSQAESPKVAAIAAATAVRKNRFCSMSTIS